MLKFPLNVRDKSFNTTEFIELLESTNKPSVIFFYYERGINYNTDVENKIARVINASNAFSGDGDNILVIPTNEIGDECSLDYDYSSGIIISIESLTATICNSEEISWITTPDGDVELLLGDEPVSLQNYDRQLMVKNQNFPIDNNQYDELRDLRFELTITVGSDEVSSGTAFDSIRAGQLCFNVPVFESGFIFPVDYDDELSHYIQVDSFLGIKMNPNTYNRLVSGNPVGAKLIGRMRDEAVLKTLEQHGRDLKFSIKLEQ